MSKKPTAVKFQNGETYAYDSIWERAIKAGDCVVLNGAEGVAALKEYRRIELLKLVPVGTTLTTVCTHHSRNGMSARFKIFVPAISPEGRTYIRNITRDVAEVAGFHLKDDEIVMGGCGYSKSFQIGYSLGHALWPNGTPEPHGKRNGEPDSDGGYAINVVGH